MPAIPYEYETHISLAIEINYQTTCSHINRDATHRLSDLSKGFNANEPFFSSRYRFKPATIPYKLRGGYFWPSLRTTSCTNFPSQYAMLSPFISCKGVSTV
jgi:hypothetical protein